MKIIDLQPALRCVMLTMLCSGTAVADEPGSAAVSNDGLLAKVNYCQGCHGSSGQGYLGAIPMPRIAGQTIKYIETQLSAFVESTRDKNLTWMSIADVHRTSPEMRSSLAKHFYELSPKSFADGPNDIAGAGKKIYDEGDPTGNVPACSGCHGPAAKGTGAIPRLAGQLFAYDVKELSEWDKERGSASGKTESSSVMAPIAHQMTQLEITGVASYLSHLE